MAELRKLQTERTLRLNLSLDAESAPGLTDTKQVLLGLKANDTARLKARKAEGLDTLEALIAQADKQLCATESSFCKTESSFCKEEPSFCKTPEPPAQPTASIPRSAPCPCGSRQKYKPCCGRGGAKWSALSPKADVSGQKPIADAPPVLNRAA